MNKSQRMWRREQERRRAERKKKLMRRRLVALIVMLAVIAIIVIAVMKACSTGGYDTTKPAGSEPEAVEEIAMDLAAPGEPEAAGYTPIHRAEDISAAFFENTAFLGDVVADTINMYGLIPQASFYTSVRLDLDNVYSTAVGYGTVPAADSLKSTKFSKIFLSFGSGELGMADTQSFRTRYEELVQKVKTYQPNAQVYVIGIPPSSRTASDAALYGATVQNITDYNRQIENIAEDNKVFYVDSVMALANSNRYLADGVSNDGICLDKGCIIDLLWYMANNSYVPDGTSRTSTTESSAPGGDEAAITSASPSPAPEAATQAPAPVAAAATPQPTVNVLKDSANKGGQQ